MTDTEEKLTAVIPDFFVELISRIAPGLVVIALSVYWSGNDFNAVFSSIGLSVFVLAAAWIIGITLDVGVFRVGQLCRIHKLFKVQLPDFPSDYGFWDWMRAAEPWERGALNKHQAQVIFFRNMMSVCLLTALICIIMEFAPKLNSPLPVFVTHHLTKLSSMLNSSLPVLFGHHCWYFLFATIFALLFRLCWLEQRRCLIDDWGKVFKQHQHAHEAVKPTATDR